MERHFHRLLLRSLLWLLVAALPLQGFAAVARLCCQPVTSSLKQTVEAAPHCHQMADDAMQMKAKPAQQMEHPPGHDCGHAACSVGASAPPSSVPSPVLAQAGCLPPQASNPFHAGYIPAGLDRPPI